MTILTAAVLPVGNNDLLDHEGSSQVDSQPGLGLLLSVRTLLVLHVVAIDISIYSLTGISSPSSRALNSLLAHQVIIHYNVQIKWYSMILSFPLEGSSLHELASYHSVS